MKFAEFSIFTDKVIISLPSEEDARELVEGLRKLGVDVDIELESLCG